MQLARSKPACCALLSITFAAVASYIVSYGGDIDQDDVSLHRSLRSKYLDPKTLVYKTSSLQVRPVPFPTIHFYIKSSGQHKYLDRSKRIAESWGKDADGRMTFLLDHHNDEGIGTFGEQHPWVSVNQVDGTDHQGEYKKRQIGLGGDEEVAFQSQRVKTRAVFKDFASLEHKPDWVCYLDDDMDATVSNLKEDLMQIEPSCSPNCMIADTWVFQFSVGGWCMQRPLAERVGDLLNEKSDEELGWVGPDDRGFNKDVMQKHLGVFVTDSDRFYSEYSKPLVASDSMLGFQKDRITVGRRNHTSFVIPTWQNDFALMQEWFPTLAVYYNAYTPPTMSK